MSISAFPRCSLVLATAAALLLVGGCSNPEARRARHMELGKKFLQQKDYARAILQFRNATENSPGDPEAFYQLGTAYLATGEWNLAAQALKRATSLSPKHTGAQVRIAELMAASEDPALLREAHDRLQEVFRSSPDNVDAITALAFTEWKLGSAEDAEKHLMQAFSKVPGHLASSAALARIRMQKKQYAEAESILKQAIGTPPSADAMVVLGEFYLQQRRTTDADQQFRQALQVDPNHATALLHLGAMSVRAGKMDQAEQTYLRLSKLPEKRYRPLHALFLFQTGKKDAGIAELRKLLQADPEDPASRNNLIAALISTDRLADADQVLTELLKNHPGDRDGLTQRAALYLTLEKYREAEEDLNRLLHQDYNSAEAHYLLSKLYAARGQVLNQLQSLHQAVRLRPDLLAARLDLSMLLIRRNTAKTALDILDEAPAGQKTLPAFTVQRGWTLLALGRMDELNALLKANGGLAQTPEMMLVAAAARLHDKRFDDVKQRARQVLAVRPDDARALELLVNSYSAEKNLPAAVQEVAALAAGQPRSATIQQQLGSVLLLAGNREQARAAYTRARELRPSFLEAELALIRMDIDDKNWEPARKSLSTVLQSRGENATARLWLANIEELNGNHSAAVDHYKKVIESDPDNVKALNNLAWLLADYAKKPAEALKYAEKAVQLAPDDAAAVNTLGWVFYHNGLYDMAVRHLKKAVDLGSTPKRNYHVALAYMKTGDQARARQTLRQLIERSPGTPEATEARHLLQQTP